MTAFVAIPLLLLPTITIGQTRTAVSLIWEAIKLAKERPELAIAAISKRMKVSVEVVRPVYQPHDNVLEEIPYVRRDSVQVILDQYPREQLKNLSYEKLVDNSLLQQLEDSGFIKALYRR